MNGLIAAYENPNLNTVIAVEPAMMRTLPPQYSKDFADLKESTAGRLDIGRWLSEALIAGYHPENHASGQTLHRLDFR